MSEAQNNMEIWDQVEKTLPGHTTKFNKGGFKGTSVNPIHNAEKATELFGPAGKGWGVRSLQTKEQRIDEDTLMVSEEVELWYMWKGERCSVTHWASELMVQRVKKDVDGGYLKYDDEAWKKCRTNATSKCLSLLGFSADLWKGYYDSEAYIQERQRDQEHENVAQAIKAQFKEAVKVLDTFCLCKSDEDRQLICQWAMEDPSLTLGSMQVTRDVSNQVISILAEKKQGGMKSHEFLNQAKKWNNSISP